MRRKKCTDDPCYIYTLIDPITSETRYIGQSINTQTRFSAHIYEAMNPEYSLYPESHKNRWIRKLVAQNEKPRLSIIETTTCGQANDRESYWIKFYGRKNLTNMTDGANDKNHFYNWDIYDHDKLSINIRRIRSNLKNKWLKRHKRKINNHIACMYGINYENAKKDDKFLDNTIIQFGGYEDVPISNMTVREWMNEQPPYDDYTDEECYEKYCELDNNTYSFPY